jgi:hypothetical protein
MLNLPLSGCEGKPMRHKTWAQMRDRAAKEKRLMQIATWRAQMTAPVYFVCEPLVGKIRIKNQWFAS